MCSKNVNGYEHFGDPEKGRCTLHDNVEDVHEKAVKKAADEAMAQVRAENPSVSDADLMIQVSDRVKQAEATRRGRAAERLNEPPLQMVGNRLAHRDDLPEERYVFPFPDIHHRNRLFPIVIGDRVEIAEPALYRPHGMEPNGEVRGFGLRLHIHDPFLVPPAPPYVFDHRHQILQPARDRNDFDPQPGLLYNPRTGIAGDAHSRRTFRVPLRRDQLGYQQHYFCHQRHRRQHPNLQY